MDSTDMFDKKLLILESGNPFLYIDPPEDWKPQFIVDAQNYLKWFEDKFNARKNDSGPPISFIVGAAGAGKSHFIRYLDYLFNVETKFKDLYSTYSAGQSKITSRLLWVAFFLKPDVADRVKSLLTLEAIEQSDLQSDVKQNIADYVKGTLQITDLKEDAIQDMAVGISRLLSSKRIGMCMVLDNIDEYLNYLASLHEIPGRLSAEELTRLKNESALNDLNFFFGTLRSMSRNMHGFLILLGCTITAYNAIKLHALTMDGTYAGRVDYHEDVLEKLTEDHAFELVYKYLDWWAKTNKLSLPDVEECTFRDAAENTMSIYPFSRSAVKEIYEVTGQFPRDIKTICSECVDYMKSKGKVWIVKDAQLYYAIEEAHKKRPQIIPPDKFAIFKNRRATWLKDTMTMRLEERERIARSKYPLGRIGEDYLINVLDVFARNLGIRTEVATSIQNVDTSRWIDSRLLRIWRYKEEKRVLVSHILCGEMPLGNVYVRHIEWPDLSDATSYVDKGVVTHILFITRWCGGRSEKTRQYYHKISWYDLIIEARDLDDKIDKTDYTYKIVGAVEADEDIRKDLVEHVDEWHFGLKKTLDRLTSKSMPERKPPSGESRTIDRGPRPPPDEPSPTSVNIG